jgi:hypothetical protein
LLATTAELVNGFEIVSKAHIEHAIGFINH